MTTKKWTVIISGVIAIISVMMFTILEFRLYGGVAQCLSGIINSESFMSRLKDYGMTISSGLFTSAFVTFGIAEKDYLDERRKVLERIYLASEDLQRNFVKIKYILPDEPRELVEELFSEIAHNNMVQELPNGLKNNFAIKHDAKNNLCNTFAGN